MLCESSRFVAEQSALPDESPNLQQTSFQTVCQPLTMISFLTDVQRRLLHRLLTVSIRSRRLIKVGGSSKHRFVGLLRFRSGRALSSQYVGHSFMQCRLSTSRLPKVSSLSGSRARYLAKQAISKPFFAMNQCDYRGTERSKQAPLSSLLTNIQMYSANLTQILALGS